MKKQVSNKKIKSFTDLKVWQKGHELVLMIYDITKTFPQFEQFGLTDQMRRSSSSVTSNVAEGFGRQTYKDKIKFYYMAQGSLTELKNKLLISHDVGYLKDKDFKKVSEKTNDVHGLLQGLIKKSKNILRS